MSLDPTISSVKKAAAEGADLLLTHHPLIFKPVTHIDWEKYPGDAICEAIKEDICIVAAHTNLDVAKGGINDLLAELLGLSDIRPLYEPEGILQAVPGRIGTLTEVTDLNIFVERVKDIFRMETARISGESTKPIKKVAVVGGSGGSLVNMAFRSGADLLITGDVGHHHFLEAFGLGMALVDAGHYNMEKKAFGLFSDKLGQEIRSRGWKVVVEIHHEERSPARCE
jgi:dinuclear metal center YbgI/SA1388 family protein